MIPRPRLDPLALAERYQTFLSDGSTHGQALEKLAVELAVQVENLAAAAPSSLHSYTICKRAARGSAPSSLHSYILCNLTDAIERIFATRGAP